ncbi:MAG: hypothetical protein ABIC04_00070 [Nanoarchaeota archaeon]
MTIIGFNFNLINAKRDSTASGKISVGNNVSIKDIEETTFPLGKEKQTALKFSFEFTSKYEPKIGDITLGGDLLYIGDSSKTKKILDDWKKDKKITSDIMKNILNTVLTRGNILALILSQEVNLPPPIPLPKVNVEESTKEEKK